MQATVSAARECSWSATTDASWVALSPDAGQGEGPVTVAVAANDAPVARSGAIVINGARVTVSQEPRIMPFRSGPIVGTGRRRGWSRAGLDHRDGRLRVESVQPGILGGSVARHRIGQRVPSS